METECTATKLEFHGLGRRRVAGAFDGGEITSGAGGVALREVEARTHILKRLGGCFEDHRRADRVEHPVERLVKQRVLGICLGYEDLNDHDELCRDRLLALSAAVRVLRRAPAVRAAAQRVGAADGTVAELARIVSRLRSRWPAVRIAVRGDGGFCREEIMAWCEAADVDYAFGLAKNSRLTGMAAAAMYEARVMHEMTGEAQRVFGEMRYRTLGSWSRERRVVAKAEHNGFGANPRFVVTSVAAGEMDCEALYEDFYCARGDMENRIKEQQLDMFADRTSTARMHANQLRLYFASFAYVLMQTLRRVGLAGTELAKAQCGTIRDKVLKVGAQVRVSVRRVWLSFAETWPRAALLGVVLANLRTMPLRC